MCRSVAVIKEGVMKNWIGGEAADVVASPPSVDGDADAMRWVWWAAPFVAFQLVVAAATAQSVGFYNPPPFSKYFIIACTPVVLSMAVGAVWHLRSFPKNPIRHLAKQDWMPIVRLGTVMLLLWLQFVALTWMKAMIPLVTPMWADVPLADFEASILGRDAWLLLPGPNAFIDRLYGMWALVLCWSVVATHFRKSPERPALMLSLFLTIGLLGSFGQYLLPSGGPIFFERLGYGDRFSAMEQAEMVRPTADYLWAAHRWHSVGLATGISAFPSIHVAATTWIAISFKRPIFYAYLAMIFAGSIILGWHYAIDGIAGAIGAIACYRLAQLLLKIEMPRAWAKATP